MENKCVTSLLAIDLSAAFDTVDHSCSGPIFFLTYISTLNDIMPNGIDLYGFADDHILKSVFSPNAIAAETNAVTKLEETAVQVKRWMDANKLKMNCSKTEFILFGSRQQMLKCHTTDIEIGGDTVERADVIRYLGAYLDQN